MVGAGKRRLAVGIGAVHAARFQRVRLATVTASLGCDPRWKTWLALTPDRGHSWSHRLGRQPQGRGDLGQRLARVVKSLPRGPLVVIGSDIPEIGPDDINEAFRHLAGHDAVLGVDVPGRGVGAEAAAFVGGVPGIGTGLEVQVLHGARWQQP
jgi:hypothetical protein